MISRTHPPLAESMCMWESAPGCLSLSSVPSHCPPFFLGNSCLSRALKGLAGVAWPPWSRVRLSPKLSLGHCISAKVARATEPHGQGDRGSGRWASCAGPLPPLWVGRSHRSDKRGMNNPHHHKPWVGACSRSELGSTSSPCYWAGDRDPSPRWGFGDRRWACN